MIQIKIPVSQKAKVIGIKLNGQLEFISFMDFQEDIFGFLSPNR